MMPEIKLEAENPWNIQSIYELQYFNCPSCIFKDQSKQTFVNHAFEEHPEVVGFLHIIPDGSLSDVDFPMTDSKDLNLDYKEEINCPTKDEKPLYTPPHCSESYIEENLEIHMNTLDEKSDEIVETENEINSDNPQSHSVPSLHNKLKLLKGVSVVHINKKKTYYSSKNSEKLVKKPRGPYKKALKTFKCDKCEKAYANDLKLKAHIRNTHEIVKSCCHLCGKSFTGQFSLKSHIRNVHEGLKEFHCEKCGKNFATSNQLKVHIARLHELIKPHQCDQCGKNFAVLGKLNEHIAR